MNAAALALAMAVACPAPRDGVPQPHLPAVRVTVDTAGGPLSFSAEEASTPEARRVGLMGRPSLGPRGAMLFEYPDARGRTFWMRDTCVALDIVFVGADGRVARVARDAEPMSDDPISSGGPAAMVLEVGAGGATGIGPGDEVSVGP